MSDGTSIDAAEEGMNTLSAQVTRQAIDKIIGAIRRERQKGTPEAVIEKALAKRFTDYDEHSRRRLLQLAGDAPIADDIPSASVLESQQPKANTLILKLSAMPDGINLYSLVRHDSKEWLVVESRGASVTLKLL